jgi:serine/threonine protein kinase
VRRDVSLPNVLVGSDGAVNLIDFGIANALLPAELDPQGTRQGRKSEVPYGCRF